MRELMQRLNHSSAMERLDAALVRIWRRRWLMVGIAWVVCLVGWILIAGWPDRYRSTAVVFADTDRIKEIIPQSAGAGQDEPTEILRRSMLTERYLAAVRNTVGGEPAGAGAGQSDISIRAATPPIFVLSFEHDDPRTAQRGLDALLTRYIDDNFKPAADVLTLDRQIEQQRQRRDAAVARLEEFKRANAAQLGGRDGPAAKLEAARAELEELQRRLDTALVTQANFEKRLAETAPTVEPEPSPPPAAPQPSDPAAQLATAKAQLAKLRVRYAETHPYIVTAKAEIEKLEAQQQAPAATQPPPAPARPVNPDYENIKNQLVQQASLIGSLRQQAADKEAAVAQLEDATQAAPSVAARLAELTRDRDTLEAGLTKLLAERDAVAERQGEHRETSFRLINAPSVPPGPTGVPRLLLLAAMLVAGAGFGGMVAIMRSRIDGVFETTRELRRRLNVAVVGSLSEVVRDIDRRQRRLADFGFGLACLALVGLCSSLMMAESWDVLSPIGDLLRARLVG